MCFEINPRLPFLDKMLLEHEIESWRIPKDAIYCLLCKDPLQLSDSHRYQKHLKRKHSVDYNISWIIKCTFLSQNKSGESSFDLTKEINVTKNLPLFRVPSIE